MIRDSYLIYKTPIRYLFVALTSALLDYGAFYLLNSSITGSLLATISLAEILARLFSGFYNFTLLNTFVYPSNGKGVGARSLKYLLLFILNLALGVGLTYVIAYMSGALAILAKLLAETIIFVLDFFINSFFVFKPKGGDIKCSKKVKSH